MESKKDRRAKRNRYYNAAKSQVLLYQPGQQLASTETVSEEDLMYGLATTNPSQHDPTGKWAYFTHSGISGLTDTDKLIAIYNDLSKSREEYFCCYKTRHNFPILWSRAGFILNVSDEENILYGGKVRTKTDRPIIRPLLLNESELADLIKKDKANREVDISPSKYAKEFDLINADIVGIFVEMDAVDGKWQDAALHKHWLDYSPQLLKFAIQIAMAVKYDLPIVLIHEQSDLERHITIRKQFERILARIWKKCFTY